MALENIADVSEWSKNFSLEQLLKGNLEAFQALFYLIIMIALYSIAIYHFYRYIARRDCFKPSKRKHTKFVGFCKYFFLFPLVAIIFFLGFSLILISLTKQGGFFGGEIESILSLSFAIIVTIRITAYYTEDLSKDVAKMLPFAVLGVFLVDSSYFSMDTVITRLSTLPQYVNTIMQFLILIILVEWILRVTLKIRYRIFPKKEKSSCY
jgi:nitrogen fixation/metabolism regulation signal transduction histidine kinase